MKVRYIEKGFAPATLEAVRHANEIIAEYQAQGFILTLRQLYYQFVARDLIPNQQKEYKRLGGIINDARLAGMIDWDAIEDRTRNLSALSHWGGPSDIMRSAAASFRVDKWETQPHRVEVWIEKEALAGVFERVCRELDVPFFSCRGYTSQSEMWGASRRLLSYRSKGQTPVILHFGDHDPSGIDMTRDIQDRMELFRCRMEVRRLALNFDQVQEYEPPPNPAKDTDSRFAGYLQAYGDESWELDALEPQVLADLVRGEIESLLDAEAWAAKEEEEEQGRRLLTQASERWSDVSGFLRNGGAE